MKRTENLRPHQEELPQLSELAGIHADPNLLKIMIELLNMKVPPHTLYSMLKSIRYSTIEQQKAQAKLSMKHDS